jgi:hypothetical protein
VRTSAIGATRLSRLGILDPQVRASVVEPSGADSSPVAISSWTVEVTAAYRVGELAPAADEMDSRFSAPRRAATS